MHGAFSTLAQRALEEWERTLCENKAVAILAEIQAGRPTIIHKDGGEMLIAIVLDKPLAEAKKLVDDPAAFTREMTRILHDKHTHPLIAQMMKPAESSEPLSTAASGASSSGDPRTHHTSSSSKTHQMTQSTQVPLHAISVQLDLVERRCHHGVLG